MKATKRNIAICGLTVVVCASLLAGVTYAWFTDSITNSGNTISSGDLKIDATAYDLGEGGKSYEINGKAYTFESEGQNLKTNNKAVIAETNWYPGQSSAKLFTVENVGSLDAAVSLDFFVSGDLTNALWFDFIQVGETGVVSGQFKERPMETLPELANQLGDVKLASKAIMSFVLVYGMEEEAQNEYMNKSFQVNVFISAKQTVEGAEGPVVVNPGTDLSEAIKEVSDNSTIVLAANSKYEVKNPIDLSGKKGIVIDGNGATITMNESVEGASLFRAKAALTSEEANNSGEESIINVANATNVIIRNLTATGAVKHGINIYKSTDVLVENVVSENNGGLGVCVNGSEVTLNNVKTSGNAWGGVNVDTKVGEVSLTVDEACSFGEYLQIYADTYDMGLAVKANLPEKYTGVKLSVPAGDSYVAMYLWTTDAVVTDAEGLASAVAAGGNVILASDISADSCPIIVMNGNKVTVNLNAYTLKLEGTMPKSYNEAAYVKNAQLTLQNGIIDGKTVNGDFFGVIASGNAYLEMTKIDFSSNDCGVFGQDSNNTFVINNCNIDTNNKYFAVYQNGSEAPSSITINESTMNGGIFISNSNGREKQTLNIFNSEISADGTAVEVKHTNVRIENSTLTGMGEFATRIYGNGNSTMGYSFATATNSKEDHATGNIELVNCILLHKDTEDGEATEGSCFVYQMEEGYSVVINGSTVTEFNKYDE